MDRKFILIAQDGDYVWIDRTIKRKKRAGEFN
jgi:hypothetical protein